MMPPGRGRTFLWLGTPLVIGAALVLGALARAGGTPAPALEKQARTILAESCFRCHSHQAGKSSGGLMLDALASMRQGGDTGPAVVPGAPGKSLLLRAVSHADDELKMPPRGKLGDEQIAVLRAWIEAGAPWTDAAPRHGLRVPGRITDADRRYWAFQPVRVVAPPAVADAAWAVNPVDRFIRQRLDAEGIVPAPPADRRTLIRRLTFDLTGLPPTPAEVDAFLADRAADAYERLVDRLLASPHYGEQTARHWLDLVRYAESDGFRLDSYRPGAWLYRDYVVRAFNADKPYDRFVREQLAGDELDPADPDCQVATGFLCLGIYEFNQRDVRTQWDSMINEVTDVTADVFLGLSFACAHCHDHKYDPILQKDYYGLRAFFAALMPAAETAVGTPAQRAAYEQRLDGWRRRTAAVRGQIEQLQAEEKERTAAYMMAKFPKDIQAMLQKPADRRTPMEQQLATLAYRQLQYEFDHLDAKFKGDAKARLLGLRKELATFDADRPTLPFAPTTRDLGPVAPPTLLPRRAGPPVEPAVPTVLEGAPLDVAPPPGRASTGRRLALATWLTRPDHPLTARVLVNRVWQQHFGTGLVATPNDFGSLGERPSHPELLDWLADRFVRDGWSLKKLHRLIVMSQTYRQAARAPAPDAALKKDPGNRLWWRMPTRRLTAEQVRDAILAVTGQLDPAIGGPGVEPKEPRRSVYVKVLRNTRDPLLDVFDAPETFTSTAKRNETTTPMQALVMLNSPFMQRQATAFADRLRREVPDDPARIDLAFRLALGRPATPEQVELARAFLAEQGRRVDPGGSALADFCLVLLNANEFLYVD